MSDSLSDSLQARKMIHDDALVILAWRNHPEVRRHMFTRHEISPEEHLQWYEKSVGNPLKHMLIIQVGKSPIGFVNFDTSKTGLIAEWGFYVAPHVPRGTGRGVCRTALSYAFGTLNLHKICGEVLAENHRSLRLHQALHFKQEGVFHDQHFDGEEYHDVIRFGLLSKEWRSLSD